jgi:integrase
MGKVRVKYLHIRSYKGRQLLYWYPKDKYFVAGKWQECPLPGRQVKSLDEAEALNRELKAWRMGESGISRSYENGSVGWLITQYKQDKRFLKLAPATQQLYRWNFPEIERVFGDRPATVVNKQHAKAFYHSLSDKEHKAAKIMQICRILFGLAEEIGLITGNPFKSVGVHTPDAREAVWTPDMLTAAKAKALELNMPSIALAIQLGIDTGQRPGDLRLLTWNRYNGSTIKLRQTKTKVWVEVPVMADLRKMLDTADRTSPLMLITEATGKPYTKDMFSRRVREVLEGAKIGKDIQFRDLRRTAVVRLAEHGCEIPEICAITGHSLADATAILEVYLPRNSKMAANAIGKLEKLKEVATESKEKVEREFHV